MENASKALLIAGGVLLAMMILAVGISLHSALSKTTDQFVTKMDTDEISKFNSNFTIFTGRNDITAQDIVTLINMVEEYSKKTYIDVTITVGSIPPFSNGWGTYITGDEIGSIKFLEEYLEKTFSYDNTKPIMHDEEGKVKSINFTINTLPSPP